MLTGKALFNTVVTELNDMGLPGMSATLDEMFRSPDFIHLDPLMAIAKLVEPEYQKKINKRIQSRLRAAHLRGCPQELSNCVDSADREYLPRGITETLSSLDFVASGMNLCILGPSDSGKSYLAKALGIVACNDYKVEYHHCEVLLELLVALKATDYMKYQKRLKRICGAALLILDDFLLHTLSDEREDALERLILDNPADIEPIPRREYGRMTIDDSAADEYISYMSEKFPSDLSGLKIAIDCANGCASFTAERIFSNRGAEVLVMGNEPDGTNINKDCGSTHVDSLMRFVTANGCDCGIAFDGAAERCLAVDETGSLADGDVIIAACAKDMKEQDKLSHNTIVFTQANNLGLLQFARANGIGTSASSTGERSMIRRMLECGYSLGGDPAGHILFPDDSASADGQLTGLRLLEVLKRSGGKMSELSSLIEKCPQVMLNVPIDKRFRERFKRKSYDV